MAPIASLVVRISGQISELQKSFTDSTKAVEGFKSSFDRQAAAIQGSIDGISKTFEQFGSVVGTIGVAAVGVGAGLVAIKAGFDGVQAVVSGAVGALSDAVNHTAELGDSLFALSQKTGVSVESLSAFKFVAGQTNTSLDSISGAVFKLEANLGKGSKATTDAINGIGLSIKDLQAQDPADAFGQIISKLGEIPNASDRAAAGVAVFGKSFKDIAQLTQEDLPGLIGQAKELGLVMSTETAVAADRFGDAMGSLRGVFEGIQLQIGAKLLPAIVAITETFGGVFIDGIKAATKATSGMGEVFDTVVVQIGQAIGRAIEVLAKMTDAVALWVSETSKRVAEQARTFLDLAPTFITVGKAFDLAFNGGIHIKAFDDLAAKLEGLKAPLETVAGGIQKAGDKIREIAAGVGTAAAAAGQNFGATYTRIQGEISAAADKMRSSLKSVGDGGKDGADKASDAFKSFQKQLVELTAQIDRAKANGTPIAELVRLFGDEAAKATPKATAWGIAVSDSVKQVSAAFNQIALGKTLDKLSDGFTKFANKRFEETFKKLQAGAHDGAIQFIEFQKGLRSLEDGFTSFANKRFEKTFQKLTGEMKSVEQTAAELANTFGKVFARAGQSAVDGFARGFQQGGLVGALVGASEGAAQKFGEVFNTGVARVLKDKAAGLDAKLTFGEKAAGWGAVAAQSFVTGFQSGLQDPGTISALSAVASGFLAGGFLLGPIGAGVGGGIALASFIAGAFKNAAEEAKRVRVEQDRLLVQFHGLQGLTDAAERSGFSIPSPRTGERLSAEQSVRFLVNTDDADLFNNVVGELNRSLDATNEKLKNIASSVDAVNRRSAAFGKQFEPLVAARTAAKDSGDTGAAAAASQQIQELAQRTQPEFERISLFVRDTFAAIIRETGDAIGAINSLAPSFDLLKKGINEFGLTSTTVIDSLVGIFDTVNNEAFKPFFENIAASGQLLKGLFDAQALSPDTFQAVAADIGQSIQEIVNRGGDMAKTLALSAPQLQTLWEAQQRYGSVTDQTTQSILAQAEAQGVVGEQFRDVNERILDVLLAIGDALGAVIPEGLRATAAAATGAGKQIETSVGGALDSLTGKAKSAAAGITDNLSTIKAPDISFKVTPEFDPDKYKGDWSWKGGGEIDLGGIHKLASGGIVRRPTLALVGERGPEAVIPLSRMSSAPTTNSAPGNVYLDKDLVGRYVLQAIAEKAYEMGYVPR